MIERYKYPRTPHLPFSESIADDDKRLDSDKHFYEMKDVIVTIKMDGENTTIYSDGYYHARSLDSAHKDYHSWLLSYIPKFQYLIPEGIRICGEYLYAKHSIEYVSLPTYFEAFSAWYENECFSWDDTEFLLKKIGLYHVPIIYIGKYDANKIIKLAKEAIADGHEGIVVRNYNGFRYQDFSKNIAKYVRPNHVQTNKHWAQGKIESNKLVQVSQIR